MTWKKTAALLLAALLFVFAGVSASAETAPAETWEGGDFSFTVPGDIAYIFTPATPSTDPSWALAGMADPSSKVEEYREMYVIADFYTEKGAAGPSFKLKKMDTKNTQSIFTMRDMTEDELVSFLERLINSNSDDVAVTKELIDPVDGQPFYRIQIDTVGGEGEHTLMYYTVLNGYSLMFEMYGGAQPISPEQEALVRGAVDSMRFANVLPRPEPEPVNVALIFSLLAVIVLVLLAPIVYIPVRRKREKRRKALMAEKLEEYRKTHPGDALAGSPLFVNETECTKECIRAFSRYHAYGKNLPSLVVAAAVCLAVLVLAFLFDLTWWLKGLAVGIAVYMAYKTISMPTEVEKIQRKVFSRGTSDTARYSFYEDGFRVGGIQSANTYPYFQIVTVRRSGQYLYLYYGPDNAYPVDCYGFTLGEAAEFEKFIREKIAQ